MDQNRLREARVWIREELDRCVKFWLENGMDSVNGGVRASECRLRGFFVAFSPVL